MERLERSGFAEFDRLSELFGRTRLLLNAALVEHDLPPGGTDVLATQTLPHIEDIEAGFRAWLRAGMAGIAELRWLVAQAAIVDASPRDDAEERAAHAEASRHQGRRTLDNNAARRLFALAHARLVFALLPSAPESAVRFPAGRRTYADIAVPKSPAELALRIEEIERELWRTATGNPPRADGAYRRTYGFFDIAEQLSSRPFHLSG